MAIFWLVWNEKGRTLTYKHPSLASAKAEAERLARKQPGDTFHVLQCIGSCRKIDVEWTDHNRGGEIPF